MPEGKGRLYPGRRRRQRVIDSAKAIGVGLATGNDPWQYASTGTHPEANEVFPVGTVLTIAAAGSEMSNADVITKRPRDALGQAGHHLGDRPPVVSPSLNPENTFTVSQVPDRLRHCGHHDAHHGALCDRTRPTASSPSASQRRCSCRSAEAGRVAIAHPRRLRGARYAHVGLLALAQRLDRLRQDPQVPGPQARTSHLGTAPTRSPHGAGLSGPVPGLGTGTSCSMISPSLPSWQTASGTARWTSTIPSAPPRPASRP